MLPTGRRGALCAVLFCRVSALDILLTRPTHNPNKGHLTHPITEVQRNIEHYMKLQYLLRRKSGRAWLDQSKGSVCSRNLFSILANCACVAQAHGANPALWASLSGPQNPPLFHTPGVFACLERCACVYSEASLLYKGEIDICYSVHYFFHHSWSCGPWKVSQKGMWLSGLEKVHYP